MDIVQTASGLTSTEELRCLDDHPREHTDWLFGTVEGRSRWATLAEIDKEFLKKGWLTTGDDDKFIVNRAVNKAKGWTATQVWGFQDIKGERRHCRNIVIEKGSESVEIRLVYDFVG